MFRQAQLHYFVKRPIRAIGLYGLLGAKERAYPLQKS